MQRTTGSTRKPRTIQEDARTINDSGIGGFFIGEDATFNRSIMKLKEGWIDHGRQSADHSRLVFAIEFRPN